MIKKARYCDVCGKEMSWYADRYRFKTYHYNYPGEETIKCRDMCRDCFTSFITFLNQRSDNNAE